MGHLTCKSSLQWLHCADSIDWLTCLESKSSLQWLHCADSVDRVPTLLTDWHVWRVSRPFSDFTVPTLLTDWHVWRVSRPFNDFTVPTLLTDWHVWRVRFINAAAMRLSECLHARDILLLCSIISMMSPDDSWVAKWQRISELIHWHISVVFGHSLIRDLFCDSVDRFCWLVLCMYCYCIKMSFQVTEPTDRGAKLNCPAIEKITVASTRIVV